MFKKVAANKYFKVINFILVGLALYFLWHKIQKLNLGDFESIFKHYVITTKGLFLAWVIFLLMLLNWSLEALKWKLLLSTLVKISFKDAVKSVLAGLTISIVTPNRTGEMVGKIFYLELKEKMKAALLNFSGSMAQMIFTTVVGLWAWYFLSIDQNFTMPYFSNQLIFVLAIITSVLAFVIYFNQLKFLTWLSKKKWAQKIDIAFTNPSQFSNKLQIKVLLIAGFRYLVFVGQLIFLLDFCGVIMPFFIAFLCCCLYFFLVWFLPSLAILEIGVRGSIAIMLFGHFSANQAAIILASTLLWLVNIALPALIGTFYVYKIKWKIA